MKIFRRHRGERGAALVEFAVLAPLLILLLLGIVEFGYLFGQFNEVRHAAREGARYAAVSSPDLDGGGVGNSDVVKAVCEAVNLPGSTITVTAGIFGATIPSTTTTITGTGDKFEYGIITVTATTKSLTGAPLISDFIQGINLSNSATFRFEQAAKWTSPLSGSC